MNYLSIGNITIPIIWVAIVLSSLLASLLNRFLLRKKTGDWYWNGFFLFFLIWKFSYLLFEFKMFFKTPISALYFNGGTKGAILALAVVSFYFLFIASKKEASIRIESFQLLLLFIASNETIIHLLTENGLGKALYSLFFVTVLFFLIYFNRKKESAISFPPFLVLFLLEMLCSSLLHTFISFSTVIYVWLAILFIILNKDTAFYLQIKNKKHYITIWSILIIFIIIANFFNPLKIEQTLLRKSSNSIEITENKVTTPKIGKPAPDFELQTLSGEEIRLSDYQGKKIVLNFWASWCPPCRSEMPHMQNFYKENMDDMIILAVNVTSKDNGLDKVREFVQDFGLTFPIPLDLDGKISTQYQAISFPTTYIIDSNGIIVERIIGPVDKEVLEKFMRNID